MWKKKDRKIHDGFNKKAIAERRNVGTKPLCQSEICKAKVIEIHKMTQFFFGNKKIYLIHFSTFQEISSRYFIHLPIHSI